MNAQMLFNQIMGGIDPMQALQRMGNVSPQAMTALNILQGKSSQQLQEIAMNMCKEQGTTPENVARSLGIKIR